jgi:hypothetical protein
MLVGDVIAMLCVVYPSEKILETSILSKDVLKK